MKAAQIRAAFLKCLYDPIDVETEIRKRVDKKYEKRL